MMKCVRLVQRAAQAGAVVMDLQDVKGLAVVTDPQDVKGLVVATGQRDHQTRSDSWNTRCILMRTEMENSIRQNSQSLLRSSPVGRGVTVVLAAKVVPVVDDPMVLMVRVEIQKAIALEDQQLNRFRFRTSGIRNIRSKPGG